MNTQTETSMYLLTFIDECSQEREREVEASGDAEAIKKARTIVAGGEGLVSCIDLFDPNGNPVESKHGWF